jgi:hypothetical protein
MEMPTPKTKQAMKPLIRVLLAKESFKNFVHKGAGVFRHAKLSLGNLVNHLSYLVDCFDTSYNSFKKA